MAAAYSEKNELLHQITDCMTALSGAQKTYQEITDLDLMDAHIYRIKSLEAQYRYLLRLAREQEIQIDLANVLH